jgi:hypothetical protein
MLMEECVRRSPGAIRVNSVSIYTSKIARRRPIPPTPPTHLNLQGISLFSNKLGSVGGVGGATRGRLMLEEFLALLRVDVTNRGRLRIPLEDHES